MPKVRLLAPVTVNDETHAAGTEIEVDEATLNDLRGAGKATSVADEEAQAKVAGEGNFSSRTSRPDTEATEAEASKKKK